VSLGPEHKSTDSSSREPEQGAGQIEPDGDTHPVPLGAVSIVAVSQSRANVPNSASQSKTSTTSTAKKRQLRTPGTLRAAATAMLSTLTATPYAAAEYADGCVANCPRRRCRTLCAYSPITTSATNTCSPRSTRRSIVTIVPPGGGARRCAVDFVTIVCGVVVVVVVVVRLWLWLWLWLGCGMCWRLE